MISVPQIRAARALLDWSQSDLAESCGLSLTAISNIDRGVAEPRAATLNKIRAVLESAGIEFTEGRGVRMRDEVFRVETRQGDDAIPGYFADVVETMRKHGNMSFHTVSDESFFVENEKARRAFLNYYNMFRRYGLRERVLLKEGIMTRYGPPDCAEYRWMSKELASQIGTSVFGNKYAIYLPDRIVTIENAAVAETFRKQFEDNWRRAKIPPPARSIFEEDMERYGNGVFDSLQ